MKSDFLRIIFDIIILIVLVVLVVYIIMVFIGVAMGDELKYIGYLNSIADAINNKYNESIFISNYDYNYVFVLTNNNGWYLQLYRCLPPNQVIQGVNFLSVKIAYWNVSTIDSGNTIIFAPALVYCKLVKQRSLNVNEINITIQGLNDNAGLLAYSDQTFLDNFIIPINIVMVLVTLSLSNSMHLTVLNDTTITCNSGCTFTSTINENGNIYCAPNPNVNTNNNLTYNPLDCVELSGFPQNPQISLSNLEGELIEAASFDSLFIKTFQTNFPILYFAGSLPPTAMYIDINRNGDTANINIYIGETVS
jgi:hypothetical protein